MEEVGGLADEEVDAGCEEIIDEVVGLAIEELLGAFTVLVELASCPEDVGSFVEKADENVLDGLRV
jgi:hypothetical protein